MRALIKSKMKNKAKFGIYSYDCIAKYCFHTIFFKSAPISKKYVAILTVWCYTILT